jgi:hypothetical protein
MLSGAGLSVKKMKSGPAGNFGNADCRVMKVIVWYTDRRGFVAGEWNIQLARFVAGERYPDIRYFVVWNFGYTCPMGSVIDVMAVRVNRLPVREDWEVNIRQFGVRKGKDHMPRTCGDGHNRKCSWYADEEEHQGCAENSDG